MKILTKYIEAHIVNIHGNELLYLSLKRAEEQIFPNIWQPVTGKIKPGETAHFAAKREIMEETGITAKEILVLPKITSFYFPEDDAIYLSPVFLYPVKEVIQIKISTEHSDFRWMTKNEALSNYVWQGQKESVESIEYYFKAGWDILSKA
jgi:dATP pyrophosphohydrolase